MPAWRNTEREFKCQQLTFLTIRQLANHHNISYSTVAKGHILCSETKRQITFSGGGGDQKQSSKRVDTELKVIRCSLDGQIKATVY